jgi:hypothetical protein
VRQQAEAEAKQRADAAAAEMAERKDLIAQLRGIEAASRKAASRGRIHVFDPTAVRGEGGGGGQQHKALVMHGTFTAVWGGLGDA